MSKGLLIAPPEAPVTGYMFGKGLYFADMVTKRRVPPLLPLSLLDVRARRVGVLVAGGTGAASPAPGGVQAAPDRRGRRPRIATGAACRGGSAPRLVVGRLPAEVQQGRGLEASRPRASIRSARASVVRSSPAHSASPYPHRPLPPRLLSCRTLLSCCPLRVLTASSPPAPPSHHRLLTPQRQLLLRLAGSEVLPAAC
jgi:hypothetical protein